MSERERKKQEQADWRHVRQAVNEAVTLSRVFKQDVDETSVRVDTAVLKRLLASAKDRGDIR